MKDLIERNAAYDAIGFERCNRSCIDCPTKCTWFFTVKNIPAAKQAAEAESIRYGQWLSLEGWFNKGIVKCSVCGNTLDMHGVNAGRGDANFCPNCGAKMDKGE